MAKTTTLTTEEQICFNCTLPADMCGNPKVMCDFMKATIEKPGIRYRKTLKQDSCGVREKHENI